MIEPAVRRRGARALLCLALMAGAMAAAGRPAGAAGRPVRIEAIEIEGNTRTPASTVRRFLGLSPGASVTPDSLVAAIEAFRASGLFESIEFESRPGSERGEVVLHLQVEERGVEFRLGAGYQDLSGWYLIPAELRLDNRLGRGERLRIQGKVGYRMAGLFLSYAEPQVGEHGGSWGLDFSGTGNRRVYFIDGVEYGHGVARGRFEAHAGRLFPGGLAIELGAGFESIEVDSSAEVVNREEGSGVDVGESLAYEELPAEIAAAAGHDRRALARLDLTWDSRGARAIAGTPCSGMWGRIRAIGYFPNGAGAFPAVTGDLRAYRILLGLSLSARLRGGWTGWKAPFHDRYYVGGLYTVRGFPSQSLSDPGGDTRFWAASIELRGPLVGGREDPRLAGILFLDGADSWSDDGKPEWRDIAAGAGFGLRLRIPWIRWAGIDVGIPLSESPVGDAFQINGSIGWTY